METELDRLAAAARAARRACEDFSAEAVARATTRKREELSDSEMLAELTAHKELAELELRKAVISFHNRLLGY